MIVDKVFLEKCEENFRIEKEPRFKAGYDTTNRHFALKGLQTKLADVIGLIEAYADDPEDDEEKFVAGEYEGMLNQLRRWGEIIDQDIADVNMDADMERADKWEHGDI